MGREGSRPCKLRRYRRSHSAGSSPSPAGGAARRRPDQTKKKRLRAAGGGPLTHQLLDNLRNQLFYLFFIKFSNEQKQVGKSRSPPNKVPSKKNMMSTYAVKRASNTMLPISPTENESTRATEASRGQLQSHCKPHLRPPG